MRTRPLGARSSSFGIADTTSRSDCGSQAGGIGGAVGLRFFGPDHLAGIQVLLAGRGSSNAGVSPTGPISSAAASFCHAGVGGPGIQRVGTGSSPGTLVVARAAGSRGDHDRIVSGLPRAGGASVPFQVIPLRAGRSVPDHALGAAGVPSVSALGMPPTRLRVWGGRLEMTMLGPSYGCGTVSGVVEWSCCPPSDADRPPDSRAGRPSGWPDLGHSGRLRAGRESGSGSAPEERNCVGHRGDRGRGGPGSGRRQPLPSRYIGSGPAPPGAWRGSSVGVGHSCPVGPGVPAAMANAQPGRALAVHL